MRFIASFSSAADGVEVHAFQVVAAPIPGKSFAVLDHNGPVCPIFSESACARALKLRPDTVLHYAAAMTSQIELAIAQCGSAVHVGVWGAAVEMSTMCAGMRYVPVFICDDSAIQRPSGHAVRRMLCPHMFPCLVNLSALNTEPPPAPLLAALPGSMCDIAPPFKFGWQVPYLLIPDTEMSTLPFLCSAIISDPQAGRINAGFISR